MARIIVLFNNVWGRYGVCVCVFILVLSMLKIPILPAIISLVDRTNFVFRQGWHGDVIVVIVGMGGILFVWV
jgi:hypothetical protein